MSDTTIQIHGERARAALNFLADARKVGPAVVIIRGTHLHYKKRLQGKLTMYINTLFGVNKDKFTRAGFETATSGLTCRNCIN